MISVLIPVYNYDISRLVSDLHSQLSDIQIPFEIIIYDDASREPFPSQNRKACQNLSHVYFMALETNHGRAAIRNMMAGRAYYEHLLFLDCDAEVMSPHFIQNYVRQLPVKGAMVGGIAYSPIQPNENFYLRWFYGVKREVKPLESRISAPYHSFSGFNFLINTKIFREIKFNEQILQYGHEDTLFGYELMKRGVEILHINNPLIHNGLESNEGFLLKTLSALKNFRWMLRAELLSDSNLKHNKLYQIYHILKKAHLLWPVEKVLALNQRGMSQNLNSNKARIWIFDCWKLLQFIRLMKEKS